MKTNELNLKENIKQHILNNKREYIIITLILIIGIFLGVLFVNNINEKQKESINIYVSNYLSKMKETDKIDNMDILKSSIKQNILLSIGIWFFGTTVIGIPIVFIIVLYRGFCLGYTIAVFIYTMGFTKGLIFILITILLQNIIIIPVILALGVSGFKLYKSIIKDKRKENIKLEIFRHTIFSLIMMILLMSSSLIETFISSSLLKKFIKYF